MFLFKSVILILIDIIVFESIFIYIQSKYERKVEPLDNIIAIIICIVLNVIIANVVW